MILFESPERQNEKTYHIDHIFLVRLVCCCKTHFNYKRVKLTSGVFSWSLMLLLEAPTLLCL